MGGAALGQNISRYKGYINDTHPVEMTLAGLGRDSFVAVVVYRSSMDSFLYKGTIFNKRLEMSERNAKGEVVGYLNGTLSVKKESTKSKLTAQWHNHDKSIAIDLELQEVDSVKGWAFMSDNKSLLRFQGTFEGELVVAIVHRGAEGRASGYFEINRDRYPFIGIVDKERMGDFKLSLDDGREIIASWMGNDKLMCAIREGDIQKTFPLYLRSSFEVGSLDYICAIGLIDYNYPKSKLHPSFSEYLLGEVFVRQSEDRQFLDSIERPFGFITPELRLNHRSYSWWEVDFWNDEVISGWISFENTWSNRQTTFPFTYDLSEQRIITLQDMYHAEESPFWDELKKQIADKMGKVPFAEEKEFLDWMAQDPFKYYTLSTGGLQISTDHNSLFGMQKVVVPFKKLTPFVKNAILVRKIGGG